MTGAIRKLHVLTTIFLSRAFPAVGSKPDGSNALRIVRLLWLFVLSPSWLFGQAETGAISGIITDTSNAVVPGAVLIVVSITTGLTRSTTTAWAGEYALTNLKPDTYNLTIDYAGFRKYSRRIQVSVAARVDVSAQLVVAGVSTTVESKWEQLMASAKENRAKLSDDDLQQTSGNREQLAAKIQETYGITRRQAEKQVWDWGKSVERTRKIIA